MTISSLSAYISSLRLLRNSDLEKHQFLARFSRPILSRLQELNDDANTEKHLRLFVANATESGFTGKLAQAYYCTGEHFLSKVRNRDHKAKSKVTRLPKNFRNRNIIFLRFLYYTKNINIISNV